MTTRIQPAEISGPFGAIVKRYSKKVLGRVPEPLGVYWHNPPVLRATMGVGGKAQKWKQCDPALKSFAHMAVAARVGCGWCLDFGYFQAFNEHLDLDKAREVPRWRESDAFTPLERDVLEYAEAMTDTPPTVDDVLVATLLDSLGEAALIELTAVIALENMSARSNVALGIESEGYADSCELKPMAKAPLRSVS
ncbi:MAG TPA: carboxymuconolactone decarboxylase family protein [Jatrophihabitantaceae bacterium]|jgi:alkylhydroperoxidase family enzyme|nr:carboxymuconolactone decarboxylase family protein [Jatrophihabitantaceae bacterium]